MKGYEVNMWPWDAVGAVEWSLNAVELERCRRKCPKMYL